MHMRVFNSCLIGTFLIALVFADKSRADSVFWNEASYFKGGIKDYRNKRSVFAKILVGILTKDAKQVDTLSPYYDKFVKHDTIKRAWEDFYALYPTDIGKCLSRAQEECFIASLGPLKIRFRLSDITQYGKPSLHLFDPTGQFKKQIKIVYDNPNKTD